MYLELCSYIVNTYSNINVTIYTPYMLPYIPPIYGKRQFLMYYSV